MQGLYGLAASLNPGDKELTPVQAWFELASRYHTNLLLSPRVLEGLKRELNGERPVPLPRPRGPPEI